MQALHLELESPSPCPFVVCEACNNRGRVVVGAMLHVHTSVIVLYWDCVAVEIGPWGSHGSLYTWDHQSVCNYANG